MMIKYFNVMLFCLLAAITQSSVIVYADDVTYGKENFRRYCASCHGTTGVGNGSVADSLNHKPADLTLLAKRAGGVFPIQRVIQTIDGRLMPKAHGDSEMPVWGQLFASQALADGVLQEDVHGIELEVNRRLQGLVLYLKTLQK